MIIKTQVWTTLEFVAFHAWKNAKGKEAYLRFKHRHKFYLKAGVFVTGLDREVEFINLQEKIQAYIRKKYEYKTGEWSCEMIATDILKQFDLDEVSVSEDGENGSTATRT